MTTKIDRIRLQCEMLTSLSRCLLAPRDCYRVSLYFISTSNDLGAYVVGSPPIYVKDNTSEPSEDRREVIDFGLSETYPIAWGRLVSQDLESEAKKHMQLVLERLKRGEEIDSIPPELLIVALEILARIAK